MTATYLPATTAACAHGCVRHGVHGPDCGQDVYWQGCDCACHRGQPCDTPDDCDHPTDPDCRGCAPYPPAPDARVCIGCVDNAYAVLAGTADRPSLPEVYDELASPARIPGGARVSGGETSARLTLADGPRWSREWIHGVLLHWCRVLAQPAPTGRHLAAPARDNTAAALAGRLLKHLDWLLAHRDHADQVVADLIACYRDGIGTARPKGPTGVTLGACPLVWDDEPCGAPIRARADQALVACPGCGTAADVWWWRDQILHALPDTPDSDGREPVATAYQLAPWLSAEHGREITVDVIRQWASDGTRRAGRLPRFQQPARTKTGAVVLKTDDSAAQAPVMEVARDEKGRTLYSIRAARDYARALYGTPAPAPLPEGAAR